MDKTNQNTNQRRTQTPRRTGPRQVEIPENPTEEEREALLSRAMFTCMWHLDRGDKTRKQLADKLRAKAFTDEYIEPTLDRLEELELVDDRDYAERYTHSRMKNGQGSARISQDLFRKGIPREIISEVLEVEKASQPEVEYENAYAFAIKKASSYPKDLDMHKKMQRLVGALTRRGFREDVYGIARQAIDEVSSEE